MTASRETLFSGLFTGSYWSARTETEWLGYLLPCRAGRQARGFWRDYLSDPMDWPAALAALHEEHLRRNGSAFVETVVVEADVDLPAHRVRVVVEIRKA